MHRVFVVEEVSELDVVNDAFVVRVAVVKQLCELVVVQWNVELATRLVEVFLRYEAFSILYFSTVVKSIQVHL